MQKETGSMSESSPAARLSVEDQSEFLADVIEGLSRPRKALPGKYLWDAAGSLLFDRICESPDYYLTRRETALLREHAGEIAATVGRGADVVEYGSGASIKVRILLDALEEPRRYLALDISEQHLHAAAERVAGDYPGLEVVPVVADYTRPIALPAADEGRRLGFFPGSTIGNVAPDGVIAFLARARVSLGSSWFLVGADANGDRDSLSRAYADGEGLMAALHGNVLARINRELGADIDLEAFRHEARVLDGPLRVEAHLVAQRALDCRIGGRRFSFAAGESIHTDSSYKYRPDLFRSLAADAGWEPVACWMDADARMSLHLLRA